MNIPKTILLVSLLLSVALPVPANQNSDVWSNECYSLSDDAKVAECTPGAVESAMVGLQSAYRKLSEVIGTGASVRLKQEHSQWLQRVAGHCKIPRSPKLVALLDDASRLELAQMICLMHFATARTKELAEREAQAKSARNKTVPEDFPDVAKTWGDHLNPGSNIPMGRFAAFYLRSGKPATLVATDTVDEVAISYPWSEFHGIRSEDFEGYWVGRFQYAKETPAAIAIDQGGSMARVIINRKLVYEGGGNARVPFTFAKGTHLVEVEFINNWHTTNLSMSIVSSQEPIAHSELRQRLQALNVPNAILLAAGTYESGAQDKRVKLKLLPQKKPVVLMLSSFNAVRWEIDNAANVDLRAVVYSSYSPGSQVNLMGSRASPEKIPLKHGLVSYDFVPRCSCTAGQFSCSGGSLASMNKTLTAVTGLPLLGVSGEPGAESLELPAVEITPAVLADARAVLERLGNDRNECKNTTKFPE